MKTLRAQVSSWRWEQVFFTLCLHAGEPRAHPPLPLLSASLAHPQGSHSSLTLTPMTCFESNSNPMQNPLFLETLPPSYSIHLRCLNMLFSLNACGILWRNTGNNSTMLLEFQYTFHFCPWSCFLILLPNIPSLCILYILLMSPLSSFTVPCGTFHTHYMCPAPRTV